MGDDGRKDFSGIEETSHQTASGVIDTQVVLLLTCLWCCTSKLSTLSRAPPHSTASAHTHMIDLIQVGTVILNFLCPSLVSAKFKIRIYACLLKLHGPAPIQHVWDQVHPFFGLCFSKQYSHSWPLIHPPHLISHTGSHDPLVRCCPVESSEDDCVLQLAARVAATSHMWLLVLETWPVWLKNWIHCFVFIHFTYHRWLLYWTV